MFGQYSNWIWKWFKTALIFICWKYSTEIAEVDIGMFSLFHYSLFLYCCTYTETTWQIKPINLIRVLDLHEHGNEKIRLHIVLLFLYCKQELFHDFSLEVSNVHGSFIYMTYKTTANPGFSIWEFNNRVWATVILINLIK